MIVLFVPVAELSTLPVPVETGISSPTRSVATWLSITTRDGFDNILTSVTVCKASRIMFGCASGPIRKLKPGNARLRSALATPLRTVDGWPGGDVGMLEAEPLYGAMPRF